MVTTTADLNLRPDLNGNVKIFCSQYDNALREIVFNIYDGDTLADLSDLTAKVEGTKPDKYGYSYDATINTTNSTVTVTLVTQMTCVAGLSHAEIVLYSDDSRVGTANFLLMVEEAGISDDTIVSDSVIPGIHDIDTLVEYAQTYADNAEASALEAEGYAAGTQNGTEVESGSEYYHHNAKYYCEQAWGATPEAYGELVEQVQTNTTDIATNATDISNVLNMLCDEWSSTVYYKAGDWLHYNGVLYKVNVGAQVAFAAVVPPNASYYDVKTITEALEELRSIIADTYSDMQTYTAGQIITFQGKLYKVIVDCTGITPPNTSYYTATTVAELIADNASDISSLNSNLTYLLDSWTLFSPTGSASETHTFSNLIGCTTLQIASYARVAGGYYYTHVSTIYARSSSFANIISAYDMSGNRYIRRVTFDNTTGTLTLVTIGYCYASDGTVTSDATYCMPWAIKGIY